MSQPVCHTSQSKQPELESKIVILNRIKSDLFKLIRRYSNQNQTDEAQQANNCALTTAIDDLVSGVKSLTLRMTKEFSVNELTSELQDNLRMLIQLKSGPNINDDQVYFEESAIIVSSMKTIVDLVHCQEYHRSPIYLNYVLNNVNEIIKQLSLQHFLASLSYIPVIVREQPNLKDTINEFVLNIVDILHKVLSCLEYPSPTGQEVQPYTLMSMLACLLPYKMAIATMANQPNANAIEVNFYIDRKWSVNPSTLIRMYLQLAYELKRDAESRDSFFENYDVAYFEFLRLFGSGEMVEKTLTEEQKIVAQDWALKTIWNDLRVTVKNLADLDLDKEQMDSMMLELFRLFELYNGFYINQFGSWVVIGNLMNRILKQFSNAIWTHFSLIDFEIAKRGICVNSVWILKFLKRKGFDRKPETESAQIINKRTQSNLYPIVLSSALARHLDTLDQTTQDIETFDPEMITEDELDFVDEESEDEDELFDEYEEDEHEKLIKRVKNLHLEMSRFQSEIEQIMRQVK